MGQKQRVSKGTVGKQTEGLQYQAQAFVLNLVTVGSHGRFQSRKDHEKGCDLERTPWCLVLSVDGVLMAAVLVRERRGAFCLWPRSGRAGGDWKDGGRAGESTSLGNMATDGMWN